MELRRVSQTHFCSWIWDFFLKKNCISPMVLWNEEFSLHLSQADSQIYISQETVPHGIIPALFFAFQFENPWQLLKFCCLKWPPGSYQFSDFISCSLADSSESADKTLSPVGQCSQPSGTSPAISYLKESQGLFKAFLTDVFIILLQL